VLAAAAGVVAHWLLTQICDGGFGWLVVLD